jgi:hypothetical protein
MDLPLSGHNEIEPMVAVQLMSQNVPKDPDTAEEKS